VCERRALPEHRRHRETEMELGPDEPNVQETRKMLREYEHQGH